MDLISKLKYEPNENYFGTLLKELIQIDEFKHHFVDQTELTSVPKPIYELFLLSLVSHKYSMAEYFYSLVNVYKSRLIMNSFYI